MNPESQMLHSGESPGLAYFGKMTATMSHELKNCLAIMNENAGLIQDLLVMNRSGQPLEPERLDRITGGISRQIQRADNLLKQMNTFAHSVDLPEQQVNLKEAVHLAASIGARLAANKRVEIRPSVSDSENASDRPVSMKLAFFPLLNLIWQTLEAVMTAMEPGTILDITVTRNLESGQGPACIRFFSSDDFKIAVEPILFSWGVPDLASRVSARVAHTPEINRVDLIFGETATKES